MRCSGEQNTGCHGQGGQFGHDFSKHLHLHRIKNQRRSRWPIHHERPTNTMDAISSKAARALTSGVIPMRTMPKIYTGKVVAPGPATKKVMTKSSSDTMNASIAPLMMPGINKGRVIRRNACPGDAYRSAAASTSRGSMFASRARIGRGAEGKGVGGAWTGGGLMLASRARIGR